MTCVQRRLDMMAWGVRVYPAPLTGDRPPYYPPFINPPTPALAHPFIRPLIHCFRTRAPCAGMPDIGQLFPDNDPKWKGADSAQFMEEAVRCVVFALTWVGW